MKVLVCGSRSWANIEAIADVLRTLPRGSEVIHGGARGADRLAATCAQALGLTVTEYPADWSNGKRAGLARNLVMLDQRPDVVLAFWDGRSTGTLHTITEAVRRSIPVTIVASGAAVTSTALGVRVESTGGDA